MTQHSSDEQTTVTPCKVIDFQDRWNVWFHRVDDSCWDIKSYRSVHCFNNTREFWSVMNNLPNVSSGMFFIMRDGIKPIYEDEQNMNGGIYSFRIAKRKFEETWVEVVCAAVGNTLYQDEVVNGISCNPKNNVIKIWLKQYPRDATCNVTGEIANLVPDKGLLSMVKPML